MSRKWLPRVHWTLNCLSWRLTCTCHSLHGNRCNALWKMAIKCHLLTKSVDVSFTIQADVIWTERPLQNVHIRCHNLSEGLVHYIPFCLCSSPFACFRTSIPTNSMIKQFQKLLASSLSTTCGIYQNVKWVSPSSILICHLRSNNSMMSKQSKHPHSKSPGSERITLTASQAS